MTCNGGFDVRPSAELCDGLLWSIRSQSVSDCSLSLFGQKNVENIDKSIIIDNLNGCSMSWLFARCLTFDQNFSDFIRFKASQSKSLPDILLFSNYTNLLNTRTKSQAINDLVRHFMSSDQSIGSIATPSLDLSPRRASPEPVQSLCHSYSYSCSAWAMPCLSCRRWPMPWMASMLSMPPKPSTLINFNYFIFYYRRNFRNKKKMIGDKSDLVTCCYKLNAIRWLTCHPVW